MESYAESVGVMKQLDTGNSLHSLWIYISKQQLLDSSCCGKLKLTMSPLRKQGSRAKKLDSRFRGNDKYLFPQQILDKLLFFVKAVVEYALGMQIGFVMGWLIGLYVGKSFVGHFEPVYVDDLSQLSYWRSMPYGFARNGAIIGLAVGIIVITTINNKLLSQRVISLYKKGRTDPKDIARALDESEKQIQRVINKLAKKRKISIAKFK